MGFAIIIVIVVIYFLLNSLNMYVNPIMLGFAIGGLFTILRYLNVRKQNQQRYDLIHGKNFVGKTLSEIEALIGQHTSVNIIEKNQRVYTWDDYLEILCDKDNNCIEVLKNLYA